MAPLFVWRFSKYGEAVALISIPIAYFGAYIWSSIWWSFGIGVRRTSDETMNDAPAKPQEKQQPDE